VLPIDILIGATWTYRHQLAATRIVGYNPGVKQRSDQVFDVDELSEYLKLPKSTVYKLAQEGRIRPTMRSVGRIFRGHTWLLPAASTSSLSGWMSQARWHRTFGFHARRAMSRDDDCQPSGLDVSGKSRAARISNISAPRPPR
jgi:excisionase family DNA binding protein